MAGYVRRFTERGLPDFRRRPGHYEDSEAYFRVLSMVTALQRDLGVRYNPAKIPPDVPLDAADTFLHGALLGEGGNCASLPVLYVAVGRRLGYPLKLVHARVGQFGHVFARWDDPGGERFNIEATNQGLSCHPDDYYRTGIYAVEERIEREGRLLVSLTPREELASFIANRAHRWRELGKLRQATNALAWAAAIAPQDRSHVATLKTVMDEWAEAVQRKEPPGYPTMYFTWPRRRYPEALPLLAEKNILYLEAAENVLNNPEWDRAFWEAMRRGERPAARPTAVTVKYRGEECEIGIRFTTRS
jgi:hypothetical protein